MDPTGYTTYSVHGHGSEESLGYYAAFEAASSHKSARKRVYLGKKRGRHCVPEADVVVKVLGQGRTSEERCDQEAEAAAKVKTLAQRFRREEVGGGLKLEVLVPGKAQVDELSLCNSLKGRPLHRGEWVLVEDELPGKFRQFTDKSGMSEGDEATVLETFAHFCYHVTQGELVVCGLQGVRKGDHFHLVSPTVHSVQQSYGPHDMGQVGVARFFKNHVCSETCQDWLTPETRARPQERPLTPSAPIAIMGGRDRANSGGSDDIDFSQWSTVGPFGSPLSPQMKYLHSAPSYSSPPAHPDFRPSRFDSYCQWVIGSPPPAYDVVPSAPYDKDVASKATNVTKTSADRWHHYDCPPAYEELFPMMHT